MRELEDTLKKTILTTVARLGHHYHKSIERPEDSPDRLHDFQVEGSFLRFWFPIPSDAKVTDSIEIVRKQVDSLLDKSTYCIYQLAFNMATDKNSFGKVFCVITTRSVHEELTHFHIVNIVGLLLQRDDLYPEGIKYKHRSSKLSQKSSRSSGSAGSPPHSVTPPFFPGEFLPAPFWHGNAAPAAYAMPPHAGGMPAHHWDRYYVPTLYPPFFPGAEPEHPSEAGALGASISHDLTPEAAAQTGKFFRIGRYIFGEIKQYITGDTIRAHEIAFSDVTDCESGLLFLSSLQAYLTNHKPFSTLNLVIRRLGPKTLSFADGTKERSLTHTLTTFLDNDTNLHTIAEHATQLSEARRIIGVVAYDYNTTTSPSDALGASRNEYYALFQFPPLALQSGDAANSMTGDGDEAELERAPSRTPPPGIPW